MHKWELIAAAPEAWLQDMTGKLAYVAGGGLVLTFGDKSSMLWQAMEAAASQNDGTVFIAGVSFRIDNLSLMGDFYRFLKTLGIKLHCIDERLEDDLTHINSEVHEHCGACAAAHSFIKEHLEVLLTQRIEEKKLKGEATTTLEELLEADLEDILIRELGENAVGKQKIYKSMPNHTSLSIFVDLHGDEAIVDEAKRATLRENNELAFQVSLPVALIDTFVEKMHLQADEKTTLLETLVKWSVQIARNIIGAQNNLRDQAQQTVIILDTRNVEGLATTVELQAKIALVQHATEIYIS